tara:strand:- start:895 stop:1071 length:177 start_codon:yes stop_codon:yes gene_type:complete
MITEKENIMSSNLKEAGKELATAFKNSVLKIADLAARTIIITASAAMTLEALGYVVRL